jgi:hypothetical protein
MFETSDAGTKLKTGVRNLETEASNATRNTRGDMSQANIELNDTLKNLVNEYLNSSSSSSISPTEQTIIDTMRTSILEILEDLKNDQPISIEELKEHYGKTIDSVLESLHPPENASQGLINKIIPIIQAITNFVPSIPVQSISARSSSESSIPVSSSSAPSISVPSSSESSIPVPSSSASSSSSSTSTSSTPSVLDASITDPIIESIKDTLEKGRKIASTLTGKNGEKYYDFSSYVKDKLKIIKNTPYVNVNEFKMAINKMITEEKNREGRNSDKRYPLFTTETKFQDLFGEIGKILST